METNQQLVHLDYSKILAEQEKFYKEIFYLKTDFSGIPIPEVHDNEFPWFICVWEAESLTNEQAFSGGKLQFEVWKYTDKPLDNILNLSFGRDALKEPYIVRCKPNYEADEDLKNLSPNKIAEMNINTLTLKERFLLGRFIYWKEKKLLDRKTITLCTGSRCIGCFNGFVPRARWSGTLNWLRVSWFFPDYASVNLRARRAVSCI